MPEAISIRRQAHSVQRHLLDLEVDDDHQIAKAARFLAHICEVRTTLPISVQQSEAAVQAAIASISIRGEARRMSAVLHEELTKIGATLKVIEVGEGGFPKPKVLNEGSNVVEIAA